MKNSTVKTATATAVKTAKTAPKTTTKLTSAPTKTKAVKVDKVTYLHEGVSGKMLMRLIYQANNEHKQDGKSFSFCLKRAIEFGSDVFLVMKGFNANDLTPANLIPLRSEHNKLKAGFSVYEVLCLIKKYYQTK
jgi:hypothetical protein